eukprot:15355213-Ditylum_brightwellii.AAC.1
MEKSSSSATENDEKSTTFSQVVVSPNAYAYNTVISAWSKCKDLKHKHQQQQQHDKEETLPQKEDICPGIIAETLLYTMMKQYQDGNDNMEPNVVSFNGVIAAWSNSNTIESGERGERLLHQMVDIKSNNSNQMMIPPDIITYNSVLHAYATSSKCGSFDAANKALNLLHKMENEEFHIKPDVYSYATVMDAFAQRGTGGGSSSSGDDIILSGATSATIGVESAETVQYLLQKMKRSKTIHPNTVCYNAALLAWARSTHFDCAERCELLLREMEKQEGKRHYATAKPDRISYNTLLQAYANSPK